MIDIDDPAQLEMLFLRLQARRVVEARLHAGEPARKVTPPMIGATQSSFQSFAKSETWLSR